MGGESMGGPFSICAWTRWLGAVLRLVTAVFVVAGCKLCGAQDAVVVSKVASHGHGHAELAATTSGLLPPAVVVHGRRGPNSDLNGVYMQDFTWHQPTRADASGPAIGPCYRRSGAPYGKVIFLYFEGEWRIGPSPWRGSVWAFSPSQASSPLLIDAPWQVWDGQQVTADLELKVSDTSVIPPVIFLSLAHSDLALRSIEGMLLQQPGLWEGRPYYRHQVFPQLYLLCSAAEGRWRLGSLLVGAVPSSPILFSRSASALPTEIAGEPWYLLRGGGADDAVLLEQDVVRLTARPRNVDGPPAVPRVAAPELAPSRAPRHLLVEGAEVEQGIANGVYRRAKELLNGRPVYHKADAQARSACLWFAGDSWRLGRLAPEGPEAVKGGIAGESSVVLSKGDVWLYATGAAMSPLEVRGPWRRHGRGQPEVRLRLADAAAAVPGTVTLAGARYDQQPKLCDARPVYLRQQDATPPATGLVTVYLFFRSQENEWWLGPAIGGTECYARAAGSPYHVVPDFDALVWRAAEDPRAVAGVRSSSDTVAGAGSAARGGFAPVHAGGGYYSTNAFGVDEDVFDLRAASAARAAAAAAGAGGAVADPTGRGERSWWFFAMALALLAVVLSPGGAAARCETRWWLTTLPTWRRKKPQPSAAAAAAAAAAHVAAGDPAGGGVAADAAGVAAAAGVGAAEEDVPVTSLECIVCYGAPREVLLVPCRHVCCCRACAERLDRCPLCRCWTTVQTNVYL